MIYKTRCGFVGVIGNTNSGKSTLLNVLSQSTLTLVSHKINATRKRMNIILMHTVDDVKSQIILVDTPGLHHSEKMLNQFMIKEALSVLGDCDFVLFVASATEGIEHYERFLTLSSKPHLVVLNKCDRLSKGRILERLSLYHKHSDKFSAIIPLSAKRLSGRAKDKGAKSLLDALSLALPESPFLYDQEDMSDEKLRDIYREKIRESLYENLNHELPYESEVEIIRIDESGMVDKIFARIYVQKESQKAIVIGKLGSGIKRIGRDARLKIEDISGKKAFLRLDVFVKKSWTKKKDTLKKFGYGNLEKVNND